MADKNGLYEVDLDEIDEKLKEHRAAKRTRIITLALIVILTLVLIVLWNALRSYTSYEVLDELELEGNSINSYASFGSSILEYSNDGIVCLDASGQPVWNRSYEMSAPQVDICQECMAVYDRDGTEIYIMSSDAIIGMVETSLPITDVSVSSQGLVAVLMRQNNNFLLKLYDTDGEEIAGGEIYGREGSIPTCIALSDAGTKLAVNMVDITEGSVDARIVFYNFNRTGQKADNNIVGEFTREDMLVADIDFLSDTTMLAFADSGVLTFEGKESPSLSREKSFENTPESVFHNTRYYGAVYSNNDEENTYHIEVYDLNNNKVMEHDTAVAYEEVSLLENNEICVRGSHDVELYTIRSIRKFTCSFEEQVYEFLYGGISGEYLLVRDSGVDEIRLK